MGTLIHFYDAAGNVIETHEHTGDFIEPMNALAILSPFTRYFALYPAMNRASAIFTLLLLLMPPLWAQTV